MRGCFQHTQNQNSQHYYVDDCRLRYRPGRKAGLLLVIFSFFCNIPACTQSSSVSKSLVLNEILQTPKTNIISLSKNDSISSVLIYKDNISRRKYKAVISKPWKLENYWHLPDGKSEKNVWFVKYN
jgi:hypothetical protein